MSPCMLDEQHQFGWVYSVFHNIIHLLTMLCDKDLWMLVTKMILPYPVRADTGITIQSLRPIKCALWLKMGFTSRTPMLSGISCLFANTRSGTPFKQLLDIILSVNNKTLIYHRVLPMEHTGLLSAFLFHVCFHNLGATDEWGENLSSHLLQTIKIWTSKWALII